ncbi:hypothetical protein B0T18DRAFT_237284 [Schizothecium vesticola]|uniref:Protein kinase domain-containing protein n=1 Tax=Schizothecium vesticola TaxID=314040 RepID=A0AA40BPK3_9PEZI|nr:hypothetical protein B0T18DRAFT_237284 [Schizothecium vesticola]
MEWTRGIVVLFFSPLSLSHNTHSLPTPIMAVFILRIAAHPPCPSTHQFAVMAANATSNAVDAELLKLQKNLGDQFEEWRTGRDPTMGSSRLDFMGALGRPHPRAGKWPGLDAGGHGPKPGGIRRPRLPLPIGPASAACGGRGTEKTAKKASKKMTEELEVAGFRFVKILGWGGLGVASLYETEDKNLKTGLCRRVVCKMDLWPKTDPLVGGEIDTHNKVAGARHVVQRVVLQQQKMDTEKAKAKKSRYVWPEVDNVTESAREKKRRALDLHENALFIEFLERGDFHRHLSKAAVKRRVFPDMVLWELFECLFRGVIGLAYPKAFRQSGLNPDSQTIPQVTETAKGQPVLEVDEKHRTIVHFDLDPRNVLVGDYDESGHAHAPIFKIGDLGFAEVFNEPRPKSARKMWNLRIQGKQSIYTPEQFSEEWDWIARTPLESGARVAGNFNWWTNLYQVGLIMWSAITLRQPPQHPEPEMCDLLTLGSILSVAADDEEPTSPEWTYGGFLIGPVCEYADLTLRNVVARCLCDDPKRRPTMQELESLFDARRAQGEVRRGEIEAAKKWSWQHFGGPPPVRPEHATAAGGAGTGGVEPAPAPAPVRNDAYIAPPHLRRAPVVVPVHHRKAPVPAPAHQRKAPVTKESGTGAFAPAYTPVDERQAPLVRESGTEHLVPPPLRLLGWPKKQSPRPTRDALFDITAARGNMVIGPREARDLRERRPGARSGAGRAGVRERPASNHAKESRARDRGAGGGKDKRPGSRLGAGRGDGRGEGPVSSHTRESSVREGGEGVQKVVKRNPVRAARAKQREDTPLKKASKPAKPPKKGLARWVRALIREEKKERGR